VKVGRAALDEDAIRQIEELNPGIEFDWTRILKGQGAPPSEPRPPAESRRQRPADTHDIPTPRQVPASTSEPTVREVAADPWASEADAMPAEERLAAPEAIGAGAEGEPASFEARASGTLGAALEDVEADFEEELVNGRPVLDAPTPAHARLGSEGVLRLRARHAEILARISEKIPDPVRREELRSQADRLNPDTWVTKDEVAQGLEQYEAVFASLRGVVGRKRRRRRRGNRQPGPTGAASVSATQAQRETVEPVDESLDDVPREGEPPRDDDEDESGSGDV